MRKIMGLSLVFCLAFSLTAAPVRAGDAEDKAAAARAHSPAREDLIQPNSASAASEYSSDYGIGNAIDGSGLPPASGRPAPTPTMKSTITGRPLPGPSPRATPGRPSCSISRLP